MINNLAVDPYSAYVEEDSYNNYDRFLDDFAENQYQGTSPNYDHFQFDAGERVHSSGFSDGRDSYVRAMKKEAMDKMNTLKTQLTSYEKKVERAKRQVSKNEQAVSDVKQSMRDLQRRYPDVNFNKKSSAKKKPEVSAKAKIAMMMQKGEAMEAAAGVQSLGKGMGE